MTIIDGSHVFEVQATDGSGNVEEDPAVWSWMVDTALPDTTIDSYPPSGTNETAATFEFSSDEDNVTFRYLLDSLDWEEAVSPLELTGLSAGEHNISIKAIDSSGNEDPSPATHTWTIDLDPPSVSIISNPQESHVKNVSFHFDSDESNVVFECSLSADNGFDTGWVSCQSPQDYDDIDLGNYTFGVKGTDIAGNISEPASENWEVDWFREEVDPTDDSGHYSAIAVDSLVGNQVAIVYSLSGSQLRSAEGSSGNWNLNVLNGETIPQPHFSIDMFGSGDWHAHYFNSSDSDMRHVNSADVISDLNLNTGFADNVGRFSSTAISPYDGEVWSTYFWDAPGPNCIGFCFDELRIIRNNGFGNTNGWILDQGDSVSSDTGFSGTSLKIDNTDSKHVAYTDSGNVFYRYGFIGHGTIVSIGVTGSHVNLDIKEDGTESHIIYLSNDNSSLMHAFTAFGDLDNWVIENITSCATAECIKPIWGSGVRLEQNERGYVHAIYVSEGDLWHATLKPNSLRNGYGAFFEMVDSGVEDDPSLDMSLDGTLHVSYRKSTGLWYAKIKP